MKLAAVAGETSGDLLAASILGGLRSRLESGPGEASIRALEAAGIGGPAMVAQGFEAWHASERLAVRGYVEVLASYWGLRKLRAGLLERIGRWEADLFLGIDAPDFNLWLEHRLRERGIPVMHFVGPSIWAWRGSRLETIRRSVDHMLLVFPFEKPLYDAAGIAATYVGHPLADLIAPVVDQAAARAALELPATRPVIAVLPGSRVGEVHYIAPAFIETIRWLGQCRPELVFVIPSASPHLHRMLAGFLANARLPDSVDCRLIEGRSHEAMAASDSVLVASGTATLEVALHKRPMVIAYRMAWASYQLMRHRAYLPWIGLPNILARDFLVPEFVQADVVPERIGKALLQSLDDSARRDQLREQFDAMHESLRCGCAQRSAEAILEFCDPPGHSRRPGLGTRAAS